MSWEEIFSDGMKTSEGVEIRVSVAENPKAGIVLGVRKWVRRGDAMIPTRDGAAFPASKETVDLLIEILQKTKEFLPD